MRPLNLRSAKDLSQGKSHGTRIRYVGGCKCALCRQANSKYECARAKLRRKGLDNGIISAERARSHILELASKGIGRRAFCNAAKLPQSTYVKIRSGSKQNIRKNTERRILTVTYGAISGTSLMDAAPVWKLINRLLKEGFMKASLAKRLGYRSPAIQFKKDLITAKSALKIIGFYRMIME